MYIFYLDHEAYFLGRLYAIYLNTSVYAIYLNTNINNVCDSRWHVTIRN